MDKGTRPDQICPYCKSKIDDAGVIERAQREFDKEVTTIVRGLVREKSHKYDDAVSKMKRDNRDQLGKLRSQSKEEERLLKAKLTAALSKEIRKKKSALAVLKRSHQEQMRNLREIYDRENLRIKSEQDTAYNAQLKEVINNYGNLATGHQKELERLKKVHDENEAHIRRQDAEISKLRIELVRSSSKLEAKELMLKLQERDATIGKMGARIQDLESSLGLVASSPAPKAEAKSMSEDEKRAKLKEYMRAIIEITRSQQAEKKTASRQTEENPVEESSESAADKLRGLFF